MQDTKEIGVRRFGGVNWLGLWTLSKREVLRFWVVWTQTIVAPLVTGGLFLLIFDTAIGERRGEILGVPFITFIAPGIMMMAVIQNAFANASSSLVISKVQGNIVDTLMPPLSGGELLVGYLCGAVVRGIIVAFGLWVGLELVLGIGLAHPILALVYVVLGGLLMGGLGVIAGIYANKFDQMAAITNFIVTPMAFLSGSFYSVSALPPVLQTLTWGNPIFYMIDGLRFAVLGVSDSDPVHGLGVGIMSVVCVNLGAWIMLRSGYRLKP